MPPLPALRVFEAAARHASFRKAAEELHVTPSAVSQQIRQLEDYLGVALFRRLPRGLALTAEGEAMRPRIREGLDHLAAAVRVARRPARGLPLHVSAPPTFAKRWLMPRLPTFAVSQPEVVLHVTSSLAMIDGRDPAPGEGPTFTESGGPVAIRYGAGDYAGARIDRLFHPEYVPVCSPQLLRGRHALHDPEDLRFHTLIHDDTVPDPAARADWTRWLERVGLPDVDAQRGPHFTDGSLAVEAAVDGLGVALALRALVRADVEAGRLVIPFEATVSSRYGYFFVTPEGAAERGDLATFRDWILEEALAAA